MIKYILIVGSGSSGKSTTMQAVAASLHPEKIYGLQANLENHALSKLVEIPITHIFNGTYILKVGGKNVIIVAGSPTEQGVMITVIIEIIISMKIEIDILLLSKRTFEKKVNANGDRFDTRNELSKIGISIYEEQIHSIEDYINNVEWKNRISNISEIIKSNL